MSLASSSVIPAAPPWVIDPSSNWVTVGECARVWNKHRNTIREWCESGFFSTLGVSTYCDPRGRWYIRLA